MIINNIATIKREKELFFQYNDKIRIKLTEKCNLSCPFCHSEGTKKTEDVSLSDKNFVNWLKKLRKLYSKVHLTGGEPTLYDNLPALCKRLKSFGYEIFLTTNLLLLNKNLFDSIPYISKINISFHTLNPLYFKSFISNKNKAGDYLKIIEENILKLNSKIKNLSINVNTVVSSDSRQGLKKILYFCQKNNILLKLVPDWRYYQKSRKYILYFLKKEGFSEQKRTLKIPGSNLRILFQKNGYFVEFKDIKPYFLDFWCNNCKIKNSCIETFAFLRLEGNPLRFKVCIGRPALTCDKFGQDFWPLLKKKINQIKKNNRYE